MNKWQRILFFVTLVVFITLAGLQPTQVHAQVPKDICAQVFTKSGLLQKFTSQELQVLRTECARAATSNKSPVHLTYTTDYYPIREQLRARGLLPAAPSSTSNMTYHGGPIMQTVTAYTIYWTPNNTIAAGYRNLVNRYFTDINGSAFYNINTQYDGPSGTFMQNNSSLGGTWTDTANSGTGNGYPSGRGTAGNPLTDTDIQNEVLAAIAANSSWGTPGLTKQYFVYYEQGIEQCYNSTTCTSGVPNGQPAYCAYHYYFTDNGHTVIYGNMPFAETWTTGCRGFSTSPNNNLAADAEISVSSHEHFEAATDPKVDAWYDSDTTGENGDKCAYRYGSTISGHNMILNGNPYIIQLEWSNADNDGVTSFSGCVKRYNANIDVGILKTAPGNVTAGTDLSYSITVTNNDTTFEATDVSWSDTLPANTTLVSLIQNTGLLFGCTTPVGTVTCSILSLPASTAATFTLVVHVSPGALDGSIVSNTVLVTTTSGDPNASNNSSTSNTTVSTSADLAMNKSAAIDPVIAGTDEIYNLIITNNGPSDAQNVTLSDAVPASTTFVSFTQNLGPVFTCLTPPSGGIGNVNCSVATLAAGVSASFSFVVHVSPSTPDGSMLSNTASTSSTTTDPDLINNSVTIMTAVITQADLSMNKSQTSDLVIADTNESYNLTVINNGSSDAQDITLTDAIPANTTFVSFTQNMGPAYTCMTPSSGGTGDVSCTITTLAAGDLASFTLVVHVSPVVVNSISNTASVLSSTTDPNPDNNSATVTAVVSVHNYKQNILINLTNLRASVTNKQDGKKLDDAIKHLSNSLDQSLWADDNTLEAKSGDKVFSEEKDTVVKLSNLIQKNSSGISDILQSFVIRLIKADRALTDIAIHQAINADGATNLITRAQNELAQGNSDARAIKYTTAIEHYRNAWQHAQQAMKQ